MANELSSTSLFNDSALKGYWKLENVNDSGPSGYTLTNNNTVTFVSAMFNNGASVATSGTKWLSRAFASGIANLITTGSHSISLWIKAPSETPEGSIFRIDGGTPLDDIYITSGTPHMRRTGLTTNTDVGSSVTLSSNTWYHIVGIYDSANSKLKIWVNGVKTEVTASGSGDALGSASLNIGAAAGGSNGFDGIIDDVAFFNRALTDAEVTALYTGNFSASPSASQSPSSSVSPSSSISASPSRSASASPSLSSSFSISLSPSASQSPSSSISRSSSSSISPSQPPGSGLFSKESRNTLPTNKNNLDILYGEEDEVDVSTDNGVRVSIEGSNVYLLHQFRVMNDNGVDAIKAHVNLQTSLSPSLSTVRLQVWNILTGSWETVASNNTALANIDFDLDATIEENQENYYDIDYEVAFRVYQQNI